MARIVNRLRNPRFHLGKDTPRYWGWSTTCPSVQVTRPDISADRDGGITFRHDSPRGVSRLEQTIKCRPGQYYRVEAVISCDLDAGARHTGLCLTLRTVDDSLNLCSTAIHRATQPLAVRAYFQAVKGVNRVNVGVALSAVVGTATIHEIRFIPIIEPEEESHPMAVPPPVTTTPAPCVAKGICVGSARNDDRPLIHGLRKVFGDAEVSTVDPQAAISSSNTDALIFPDDRPPAAIRSLQALFKLAEQKIVILSLPAFCALSRGKLSVRTIEQADDPIHARVVYANWATTGFALHDSFPYAWPGRVSGSFVQRHFRLSPDHKAFCTKHQLTVVLDSMCDSDATSHRPVCLLREFPRGALVVLDLHPLEAPLSTMNEPTIAMHLLLSILGRTNPGLGQYAVPYRTITQFRQMLRDFSDRVPAFIVHDDRDPRKDDAPVLVTVGGGDESFGLPLQPKPLILIRSGGLPGEVESVYATLQWLKNLLRPPPHDCAYADVLARRFRFAWIPTVAPWHVREGWRAASGASVNGAADQIALSRRKLGPNGRASRGSTNHAPRMDMALDVTDASLSALIDVTASAGSVARVVVPDTRGAHGRIVEWLPHLTSLIFPASVCVFAPVDDASASDYDGYAWRTIWPHVVVEEDASAFSDRIHRDARRAGAAMVRVELPRHDADFVTHSIHRTALGATLLEQVIGLASGLILVNRAIEPVTIHGFPPLPPGQSLVLDQSDTRLHSSADRAESTVTRWR